MHADSFAAPATRVYDAGLHLGSVNWCSILSLGLESLSQICILGPVSWVCPKSHPMSRPCIQALRTGPKYRSYTADLA